MNYLTPTEAADAFRRAAIEKEKRPFAQFALMAVLGGAFIAFGGLLTVMVAGGMPGVAVANPGLVKFMAGALFPIGLIMVSVTGADLFTSDCAGFGFPLLRKELTLRRVAALAGRHPPDPLRGNFLGPPLSGDERRGKPDVRKAGSGRRLSREQA